jgi:hypothetical protein
LRRGVSAPSPVLDRFLLLANDALAFLYESDRYRIGNAAAAGS